MNPRLSEREITALRAIKKVADSLGIALMVVGASARELVFDRAHGLSTHRTTTDWDIAVLVPTWKTFDNLRAEALSQGEFKPDPMEIQKLVHIPTGMEIDLVPFGGVEQEGRIQWPTTQQVMQVDGFHDAFDTAIEVDLAPNLRLKFATVPLLFVMKVFAASDRAERTDRDVQDLKYIMSNYPTQGREGEVFEEPLTQVAERLDWSCLGPLLLGLDIGHACRPTTLDRMMPILDEFAKPYGKFSHRALRRTYTEEDEEQERQRFSDLFVWLTQGIALGRPQR